MSPRELLTLTPLMALTVILGLAPGFVLNLIQSPVGDVLARVSVGGPTVGILP